MIKESDFHDYVAVDDVNITTILIKGLFRMYFLQSLLIYNLYTEYVCDVSASIISHPCGCITNGYLKGHVIVFQYLNKFFS